MVDTQGKGWVTGPELLSSLADYGIYPHKEDVYLFTRHYDRDSDGRLLFSDFCDAFCPLEPALALELNRRDAYHVHKGFSRSMYFRKETRDHYMRVIRLHMSIEESAELLRKKLQKRPGFSLHSAFSHLDVHQQGYLTEQDFMRLMHEH